MKMQSGKKEGNKTPENKKITRKEALKKAGRYAALTAATMLILDPTKASAEGSAPAPPPSWPY
jgi:hypothetical protein